MPDHIGSCAWMSAFSKYAWRHGPDAYPLPGMGGYSTLACPQAAVLQLIPIGPFVESGLVALADLAGFLETDSGLTRAQACDFRPHEDWGRALVAVRLLDSAVVHACGWADGGYRYHVALDVLEQGLVWQGLG